MAAKGKGKTSGVRVLFNYALNPEGHFGVSYKTQCTCTPPPSSLLLILSVTVTDENTMPRVGRDASPATLQRIGTILSSC